MPYFTWRGVNILGNIRKGKTFARSEKELDALLFSRDIALLSCQLSKPSFFARPIDRATKIQFFSQLCVLLRSGVLLPQALVHVGDQIDHPQFQEIVHTIADKVHAGATFSAALSNYAIYFDRFMVYMIHVGQEMGDLAAVLDHIGNHLQMMQTFEKKMRSALLMPMITLCFFVVIVVIVLVVILPRFASLFATAGCELPWLTSALMNLSSCLLSWTFVGYSIFMVLVLTIVQSYLSSPPGRQAVDAWSLRVPLYGTLVSYGALVQWLQAVSLLVSAGVLVLPAVKIAQGVVRNTVLQKRLESIEYAISSGSSLSEALAQHPYQWFDQQSSAMIRVGEQSGKLGASLSLAAGYYRDKVEHTLSFLTTIIQPLLVLVLGVLVALFIFAVYLPLLNLSLVVA
jgi:type IV pilus assembly protein PilC